MHIFPDVVLTPPGKALVDGIPLAIIFWQQAPLGSTTGNPEHRFQEAATVSFRSSVSPRMFLQECIDLVPFIFSKIYI